MESRGGGLRSLSFLSGSRPSWMGSLSLLWMKKESAFAWPSGGTSIKRSNEFCSDFLLAAVKKFAGKRFEEVAAPDTDEQSGAKEQDGVEACSALARPVNLFLKIEPQRELVQSKRSSNAIKQRHQATGKQR